jgi:hypothetical protein
MAKLGISTGTTPNDGLGDNLLAGAVKINSNFSEIYTQFGDGTNLTAIGGTWTSTSAGIHTLKNVGIGTTNPRFLLEVGAVGASGTTLFVNGDARITGIVTIGPASITLDGTTNIINVGTGITINGSTGIISATSIVLGGTTITGAGVTSITAGSGISVDQSTGNVTITATGGGSSQWVTTAAGIHTLSNVGIGTTNPTSALTVTGDGTFTGVVTATTFVGALTGTATAATLATNAQGLTGTPNITVGVATATTFVGSLTGTATTATLATNAQGLTGTPDITVNKIVAGLTSSIIPFYWENFSDLPSFSTYHGAFAHVHQTGKAYYAHTRWVELVNKEADGTVGTGTENFNVGLVTATTFVGALTGTATTATNAQGLTGTPNITVGTINGSSINVSGISTLGTVQISSGIVTATSGIVTYFGDTSNAADGRWTLGANGTSDYTFTGIGFTQTTNDPVLYLARGRVYEFVNNSGGSHPFQIRVSDGGAAYSNGVTNNSAASGVIRFEVPFNAPNTLYYQCTSHSGMGNTISVYPTTI